MTVVKICGIRRKEDVECLNRARPDMAGFVFYKPSRRCVSIEQAVSLRNGLDPSIRAVGVFVDEDPRVVADAVDSGAIDMVQLHGCEDEEYIRGLRKMTDAPMIKAFVLRDGSMIGSIEACGADMVLLDAGMGSGKTFDWSLASKVQRDYILSGGLTPDNVARAVEELSPYGVDVSSGVETDGSKDGGKIDRFLSAIRRGSDHPSLAILDSTSPVSSFVRAGRIHPFESENTSSTNAGRGFSASRSSQPVDLTNLIWSKKVIAKGLHGSVFPLANNSVGMLDPNDDPLSYIGAAEIHSNVSALRMIPKLLKWRSRLLIKKSNTSIMSRSPMTSIPCSLHTET